MTRGYRAPYVFRGYDDTRKEFDNWEDAEAHARKHLQNWCEGTDAVVSYQAKPGCRAFVVVSYGEDTDAICFVFHPKPERL
jgi:hypothetical protein